jgi:hypothetical protein
MQDKQDTFLDGLVMNYLSVEKKDQYGKMGFEILFHGDKVISLGNGRDESFTITDMEFRSCEG